MIELRLDDKLNFVEETVEVMDQEVKKLKQSCTPIVKVRWNSKRGPEFTWEHEYQIRANTFHISYLKKCLSDESLVIPMIELRLDDKLNFVEETVEVMDQEVKKLKQSCTPIVKVRWNSKRGPEFTWEHEYQIRAKYPHLFSNITLASN
nr:putative reverse transcriptase domain-containing protein [Tanacetum cinerariifolium]